MYNYVFFDLDGTLIDPAEGITNSVAFALEKFGIIINDRRELYKFIGPPLIDSFADFYGFCKEDCLKAIALYREYFSEKGIYQNVLYPDIFKLVLKLKDSNIKIILATSKPHVFAEKILKHFDLYKYFDFLSGATLDGTRSKKDDIIEYAIESLKIKDKSKIIMVGDRKHDIVGAKQNGISSIGVLYGYGNEEELCAAGADYIAENVDDILNVIINN